jgi:ParB family transcriptional regulator, chromosome partitioning protein
MGTMGRDSISNALQKTGISENKINKYSSQTIMLDQVIVKHQPRKAFRDIEGLAMSIEKNGLLNPIIVMEDKQDKDKVTLIAGERRLRAFRLLLRLKIPAIVLPFSNKAVDIWSKQIIENMQRDDLTTIEKADSIAELRESGLSSKEVSNKLGLNDRTVRKYLQISDLSQEEKARISTEGLGMRDIEKILSRGNKTAPKPKGISFFRNTNKHLSINKDILLKNKNVAKDEVATVIIELESFIVELKNIIE